MQLLNVLTALCLVVECFTHNILVFLPNKIWTHYVQVEPVFHALALRGHNVTVMSPYPPKRETPNLRHFFLAGDRFLNMNRDVNPVERSLMSRHELFNIGIWKAVADQNVPQVLESAAFNDLTRANNKFDLIFTELFFGQEALVVLGHIFNAPVVTYSSYGYESDILRYSGAANAAAYLPIKISDYAGPMSLLQRLDNALLQFSRMLFNEYWYYPQHDELLSRYIPGALPRISDMLRNISLFFLTANTALDGAKLYPPNVIEISGIHFGGSTPLDKELKTIMDETRNGVVLFCFGSLLKMSHFRKEDIHTFLAVFEELDQTVLWKTDLNTSDWKIPKNVYTRNWFDQASILAHPNCVLFLTHGGVSSTMEAIQHGVPIVGMPIFGDQTLNLAHAEYHGYGLRVLYKHLSKESLLLAIRTVLGDPRFKENISKASKVFTDKPMSSLDSAVYWMEYVIRYQGARHLKPLAAGLPSYQLFLLDVIIVYLAAFLILLYLMLKIVSIILGKCVQKSKLFKEKSN